jgi:glycosidase
MLSLYRALAKLRREEPALSVGDYASVETAVSDIFAYKRTYPGVDSFLIVLNFGGETHTLDLSHVAAQATIAVATDMQRGGTVDLNNLIVEANEGFVFRL